VQVNVNSSIKMYCSIWFKPAVFPNSRVIPQIGRSGLLCFGLVYLHKINSSIKDAHYKSKLLV